VDQEIIDELDEVWNYYATQIKSNDGQVVCSGMVQAYVQLSYRNEIKRFHSHRIKQDIVTAKQNSHHFKREEEIYKKKEKGVTELNIALDDLKEFLGK